MLKYISVSELDFEKSYEIFKKKFKKLSPFDKFMTAFWFLGPFIYLIERSPADIWLTLIGLIFILRCILKKEWSWASQLWFKLALTLWVFGLFSALTGPDSFFSFKQGFVWIRFPLYVAAAQVWLGKDRDIRITMLLFILIGMIIMSAILISESLIEPKLRLTWPYGDLVPGSYIAKFSLPLFCTLIAIAVNKKSKAGVFSGFLALLTVVVSALTGERGNFVLRACAGMLAGLVWRPKFILYASLIMIQIIAVFTLIYLKPDFANRYGEKFLNNLPIPITIFNNDYKVTTKEDNLIVENQYWGAWRGGIQQGLITPFKGIGPSGTRKTCKNLNTKLPEWLPGKNYCGNHPHNFYIQLFAEIGVIGLIIGSCFFISIITTCYKARNNQLNCPMSSTAFVVPLAFFFPIQQFGSFYGQWGNLFTWFAIAFAISQYQGWRKSNNIFEK